MDNIDRTGFCNGKHRRGEWNTRVSAYRARWLRSCAGYVSAKRRGVDRLAAALPANSRVLDAGAGTGGYCVWFVNRTPATVVGVDASVEALRLLKKNRGKAAGRGRILPVCARLEAMPFKSGTFDAIFSIDTLGHVENVAAALDEFVRLVKKDGPLFLHSECADYRSRWPDKRLIEILGRDYCAELDGHTHLLVSREFFTLCLRRFRVISFVNPAGYLGWCLGYPEKYRPAFSRAGLVGPAALCSVFAFVKRLPAAGGLLRIVNAMTNHFETYFDLRGGGSCFCSMRRV
jgi:ubiquinone/menaquinone biosynthesis C-methylase UbiE